MQKACKIMGFITLIFGIIGTIILAVVFGKESANTILISGYEKRNWALTIGYLFSGGFATAVLTVIFFSIAEILDYLQYNYEKNEPELTPQYEGEGWKCECGRTNPNYTGTCTCGRTKP